MKKFETTLQAWSNCTITLFHDPEDPLSWVVRKWKKKLFWRKCMLNRWFNSRGQAEQFAAQLAREHGRSNSGVRLENVHG